MLREADIGISETKGAERNPKRTLLKTIAVHFSFDLMFRVG